MAKSNKQKTRALRIKLKASKTGQIHYKEAIPWKIKQARIVLLFIQNDINQISPFFKSFKQKTKFLILYKFGIKKKLEAR